MGNNPITKFISDGEIYISAESWDNLKSLHDKESLIEYLSDKILDKSIELPLRKISIDEAKDSFSDLCRYPCNPVFDGKVYTRYEYEYLLSGRYIDESVVGNNASDYFHQYARFCCDSINSPSPVRVWESRKFLHSMLGALWSLKCSDISMSTFRTLLSLRKYIASQYKPAIAKSIYEKYNSKDVLDFSAGWGDRLCGFYATEGTRSYIGIDPNVAVFSRYQEQVQRYEEWSGIHKETQFINLPAEEVSLPRDIVDTVFTSPPYFNIERYSQDDTQSYKRYKKLDQWLDGFMYPTLSMSWNALKSGGYLIVNISDVYSGHTVNKICDSMNRYIRDSLGGVFVECLGMRMAKRPNSKATQDKDAVFVEPIWVWRKP